MAAGSTGKAAKNYQKSYFDVLGLCCSSEVPLIENILKPLEGIEKVFVIVPTRTVIVVHDNLLISQLQIVKALNQARLEANLQVLGAAQKSRKTWPSPYTLASGLLLSLSFLKYAFKPLYWLALAAAIVGLPPILMRSFVAARRLTLDINILMLISVAGTIAMMDFVEAAFIVFLFTIAEWLESRASHKASAVMSMLMNMAPQTAVLAENGLVVSARDVKVNTVIAVKAGEVIPIDGVVVEGKSEVDERTLTGESFPVAKQVDSSVWAGTINLNGYISVKTTALAEDSTVARMAKLVEEAENNKSQTQRMVDKCAKYYTPAVVLISACVAVIPTAMRVHSVKHWYHLALVLLVSACPCALVLSTPMATFCALTKAATIGLLIKGGDYLEALAKIKIMAFDKTGTITKGEFTLMEFRSLSPLISTDSLLDWVSSIESKSSHPMAAALVEYGRSNGVFPKPDHVTEVQIFPGEGIYGVIEGKSIYIGNKKIVSRAGYQTVPSIGEEKGVTMGYILSEATPIGIFSLADNCRSGASEAIAALKSRGIHIAMLTGDSHPAAMHIQAQLGNAIDHVHAELLPEDKVSMVKELKKKLGPTAMIGDGMNDAPALAAADIGISMGVAGSAVATETAPIVLMSNDLRKIPQALSLSTRTRRTILLNISFSILTKAAILALAFAGHPLLWAAVLADVGTCLLVILNSMLLLRDAPTAASSHHDHNHHHHQHSDQSRCCGPHSSKTIQVSRHGTCNKENTCTLRQRTRATCEGHKKNCCSAPAAPTHNSSTCNTCTSDMHGSFSSHALPSSNVQGESERSSNYINKCASDVHGSCASHALHSSHVHGGSEPCKGSTCVSQHRTGAKCEHLTSCCSPLTSANVCNFGPYASNLHNTFASHPGPSEHVQGEGDSSACGSHGVSLAAGTCEDEHPILIFGEGRADNVESDEHRPVHCLHGGYGQGTCEEHVRDAKGGCGGHALRGGPIKDTCREEVFCSHVCVETESRKLGGGCKRQCCIENATLTQIVVD